MTQIMTSLPVLFTSFFHSVQFLKLDSQTSQITQIPPLKVESKSRVLPYCPLFRRIITVSIKGFWAEEILPVGLTPQEKGN